MEFSFHTQLPVEIKDEWNVLLETSITNAPFLRWEYLQIWWQTRGGGEWPDAQIALVTARDNGRLIGAAPLLFAPNYQGKPALLLLGSIEVSDYLDLLVAPQDLDAFVSQLLPYLANNAPQWDVLDLYNVPEESPSLPALEKAAAALGWNYVLERYKPSPYITLPGDFETYLAGIDKKQRHEIRRKMRRLEESGRPWRWYVLREPAEVENEIEGFLRLMEQEQDKANFLSDAMREHMRLTMRCFAQSGHLYLAFLEIDGIKASAKLCFDYQNKLMAYNSGLDRQFTEFSTGWVLLGHMLRWANENGRQEFDFMRGDEDYKYRFGSINRYVMQATITRPA